MMKQVCLIATSSLEVRATVNMSNMRDDPDCSAPHPALTIDSPLPIAAKRATGNASPKATLAGRGMAHRPVAGAIPYGTYSNYQETGMLSAHEFATLMLVRNSADHIAERQELDTLLERQLVAMEQLAGGTVRPRITQDGNSLLRTLARLH
jgi:hypothetical protein